MKRNLLILTTALACATGMARGTEAVQLNVQSERKILLTSAGDTILQVELEGQKKPTEKRKVPLNLALVIDRSGSMSGAKIEKARQAACVALDQIESDDTFALVAYDDDVNVVIPAGKVTDKDALERKINAIEPGGGTGLHAGVKAGAAELKEFFDKEKINRVILLSDGLANIGPSSPGDLAKLGSELSGKGISVSTIGLGDDYNEDLMEALAEASEANYYYVKDAEKLPEIFTRELGSVKSVVARNLRLIITLPDGLAANSVAGESFSFKGSTLTIPLSEMSGGQKRRFLVNVNVPVGKAGEIKLADVHLEYEDTDGETRRTSAVLTANRTEDTAKSERSVQTEVVGNVAVINNRIAKQKAVALADSGRAKDAAAVLRAQFQSNAALPAAVRNDVLAAEQKTLQTRAAELDSSGSFSKASRKGIRYENYQDKKQQR